MSEWFISSSKVRNHLGLKWVFIHNKTTSQSRYDSMYATPGNLFINPVGIWPSYSYPSGYS